jgi:predicted amidophosphoribosyltransferase
MQASYEAKRDWELAADLYQAETTCATCGAELTDNQCWNCGHDPTERHQ